MERTRYTFFTSAAARRWAPLLLSWIALVFGVPGCDRSSGSAESPVVLPHASAGIDIQFAAPVAVEAVRVLDAKQTGLLAQPFAGSRRSFYVPFRWQAGREYELEWVVGDRMRSIRWQSPAASDNLAATIAAPAGQDAVRLDDARLISALVPPDGRMPLTLSVTNEKQQPAEFRWTIETPSGGEVAAGSDWQLSGGQWSFEGKLALENQTWQQTIAVAVPSDAQAVSVRLEFAQRTSGADEWTAIAQPLTLTASRAEQLAGLIEAGEIRFPTDAHGVPQPERSRDEVRLANPVWGALLNWLRPAGWLKDQHAEYAWQTLPLTNHSAYAVNVGIESEVVPRGGAEPLLTFAPPAWKTPRESPTTEHLLRLGPQETALAVLPFNVRDDVLPGAYERRLRVRLVGAAQPLLELKAPLQVTRGSPVGAGVVILSLLGAGIAWGLSPWIGPRLLRQFSVEHLTTIALLSGAHFLAAYGARFVGDVVAGVAGPFAVFLSGIGNEGLTSALVAALLVLVPRVGVLALSSLTVCLLQAMFTGQLGFVDLVMVTVSILIQESLLWGLRVTRFSEPPAFFGSDVPPAHSAKSPPWSLSFRLGLAIGLGNALALYAQFCLATALYRLYFASWYIAAVALLTGLVYGGIGAASGASLGLQLRRTAR